jgi:hypothetical protein
MRLHRCVPVLAAVVSLAGVSAPLAEASDAMAPGGGGPVHLAAPAPHQTGSSDWLIGLGTATGIVVLGTGAIVTARDRRASRRVDQPERSLVA